MYHPQGDLIMEAKVDRSKNMPPPMLIDEVRKLKARQGSGKFESKAVEELQNKPPALEEYDGRVYPKGSEAVAISGLSATPQAIEAGTAGYIPEHVDVDFTPKLEPRHLRRPKFIERGDFLSSTEVGAKTIFGADNRRVFYSTAYPWRCNGKVETPIGSGSGVMIGPRHLLTCSHVIDWRPNNTTGWLKFTPMYYNGSAPYGSAWAIRTYYKVKVSGPTIDSNEAKFDYVVVVLDRTMGNATGWMGSKSYSDSWDGGAYWTHAGYPGDLTGGQRPTYETGIALDGDFWSPDSHEAMSHKGDVWPGQSGGGFWGYWDNQPYAVAVQSSHNPSDNFASGGSDLVDLVIKARAEFP
jgi:V8-like Glu-specific endopeptidase